MSIFTISILQIFSILLYHTFPVWYRLHFWKIVNIFEIGVYNRRMVLNPREKRMCDNLIQCFYNFLLFTLLFYLLSGNDNFLSEKREERKEKRVEYKKKRQSSVENCRFFLGWMRDSSHFAVGKMKGCARSSPRAQQSTGLLHLHYSSPFISSTP